MGSLISRLHAWKPGCQRQTGINNMPRQYACRRQTDVNRLAAVEADRHRADGCGHKANWH